MWNTISCHVIKCDTSVSLKLFPLRSVLTLIILKQEPLYCSYFLGWKEVLYKLVFLEVYVCIF